MLLFSIHTFLDQNLFPFIGGAVFAVLVQILIAVMNYRQQEKFQKEDDEQAHRYNTVFGNEKPGLINGETNLLRIEQLNQSSTDAIYGECGVGVFWKFVKASKVLEIHGYGPMIPAMGYEKSFENDEKDVYLKIEKLQHEAKKLIIFEGINYLENYTFSGFDMLEEAYIGPSIKRIPFACFKDCVNLKNVYLPYELEEIEASAFENCSSLQDVSLPRKLKRIGRNAFFGCSNFQHLKCVNNRLRKIDDCAFSWSGLRTVEINTIGEVSSGAFSYTDNLESVCISWYRSISDEAFLFSGVRSIELWFGDFVSDKAFSKCEQLQKIQFGPFENEQGGRKAGVLSIYPIGLQKITDENVCKIIELPSRYKLFMKIKSILVVIRLLFTEVFLREK